MVRGPARGGQPLGAAALAQPHDGARGADGVTLILPLLFTFLLAGQFVRKWNAATIAALTVWIACLVGIHIFILR